MENLKAMYAADQTLKKYGGEYRVRTGDLLAASQTLSQLS